MPAAFTPEPSDISGSDSDNFGKNQTANWQSKPPSFSTLDKAGDCQLITSDGTKVSFKSLYTVDPGQRRRILVLFIRHFFCGNCQEYIRSLKTQIPPDSLPRDVSIAIIGCGSHTLIASYIIETGCPYPIYTDPSKKLYDVLGLHRSLSLGWKGPDYIQHTLVAGMVKSIVQATKRFSAGDALSGGDMRLNGGEFLIRAEGNAPEEAGGSKGNPGRGAISVTWCHRMINSRDHTEIEQIRSVLGLGLEETPVRRRPERRWTSGALRRSLSSRRQSWLERTNSLSRNSSLKDGSRQSSRRRSPVHTTDTIREEIKIREEMHGAEGVMV